MLNKYTKTTRSCLCSLLIALILVLRLDCAWTSSEVDCMVSARIDSRGMQELQV